MRPLLWFRADLRVTDNPALSRAADVATRGLIAIFVICPKQWRDHDWGDNRAGFVIETLRVLAKDLHKLKIPLLVRTCDRFDDVPELLLGVAQDHGCDALFYNREYEINEAARDEAATRTFLGAGLGAHAFTDQVIVPPGSIRTGAGDFYTVFTPYKKKWIERVNDMGVPTPVRKPKAMERAVAKSDDVPDTAPGYDEAAQVLEHWAPGEEVARRRLRRFVDGNIGDYNQTRNLPGQDGTSRLSPYLAVGAISIRQCLAAAYDANGESLNGRKTNAATWISELVWREFYRHIVVGYPRVAKHRAFKADTEKLRWRNDEDEFDAWREGRTGYPIVDAGMRQLLATGWMHNRLRMIVAMFLTKDLFIDWRWGERHFMEHLVDGDLASNNGGWQWAASTGTDAAPYFRIFNPFSQSRKCDPDGSFIRTWVPELTELEGKHVHEPHEAAPLLTSDLDYPTPIVDHAKARERTIKAFKKL